MVSMDMVSLMQENHLLRKMNRVMSIGFIDGLRLIIPPPADYQWIRYAWFKMLLIWYLYGIKS